jgi:hypothetical protein
MYTHHSAAIFFDCPLIRQDGCGIRVTSTISLVKITLHTMHYTSI